MTALRVTFIPVYQPPDTSHPFALAGLTAKERQVLDLLIEHTPVKAIAAKLGIAYNTADMRLRSAKTKLGAPDRASAARAYRKLVQTYENEVAACEIEVIAPRAIFVDVDCRDRADAEIVTLEDANPMMRLAPWASDVVAPRGLEVFGDRLSPLLRIALMVATAFGIGAVALVGMAIIRELARSNIGSLVN